MVACTRAFALLLFTLVIVSGACSKGESSTTPTDVGRPAEAAAISIVIDYDGTLPVHSSRPTGDPVVMYFGKVGGAGTFISESSHTMTWISGSRWQVSVTARRGWQYAVRFGDVQRGLAEMAVGLPYNLQGLYAKSLSSTGVTVLGYGTDPLSEYVNIVVQ
jgi:hypothetical protein